ncbi:helix-turn-helix domain-containing protein [Bacteroides sp. 519]|uniref:helix-turn-helix domain-containing protein n=1 Tax=Bacteroides sp. 519 TaxID=2302937 RepID=UPI0013D778BC|nr:helix-turn-helix domain-containing protein [Bacteroides sp. 519]NDV58778.1 DNA-binding protein [Bacteroides sp. 519]
MNIDDVLDSRSKEMSELFSAIRIGSNKIYNYKKLRKPTLLGEAFFTNKEVCKLLGLGLRTLQDYRERGHLAYYKIEGKVLYKLSDVLQMLENNYFDVWKRKQL